MPVTGTHCAPSPLGAQSIVRLFPSHGAAGVAVGMALTCERRRRICPPLDTFLSDRGIFRQPACLLAATPVFLLILTSPKTTEVTAWTQLESVVA